VVGSPSLFRRKNVKICALVKKGYHQDEPRKFRALVVKAKWYCGKCGRTAVDPDMLCDPQGKKKRKD